MNKQINRPSHESELRSISMKARLGRRSKIAIKLLSSNRRWRLAEKIRKRKNVKIVRNHVVSPLFHAKKMFYEASINCYHLNQWRISLKDD